MKKFYITSAIPYVNAAPHIGHAQEFVYADTIKRYHQLRKDTVCYLCGADENALKIVQAAEKAGKSPQEFTDFHQQEFLTLLEKLNVIVDVWQRGTDKTHHFPSSAKLWQLCDKNGDIYKKSYTGLYCVGCEQFYTPDELDANGECFEHPGKKLEEVTEENYFFRLSKYQDFLEKLIGNNTLKVIPDIRRNEAIAFIRKGLEDFSISRSKSRAKNWGVPVPGDSEQIMYVWFDALNIYQTGIGFSWDEKTYQKWSPQDLMVIGKGILRFHAIYWPAILQSAGLQLPKSLFVHGYLTVDGQKMSKTVGNVIDPMQIIEKYGTDALRYYLLREIPSYSDGDFSERRFIELYNSDLANGLGNLTARIAKLCDKKKITISFANSLSEQYKKDIERYKFDEVLAIIWDQIRSLDRYIDQNAPWKIQDESQLVTILEKAVNQIITIAYQLQPFLPQTASAILDHFLAKNITAFPPLFPRIKTA